jgi:hypothetical protein
MLRISGQRNSCVCEKLALALKGLSSSKIQKFVQTEDTDLFKVQFTCIPGLNMD